ncbi:MAG: alpha/beta hydrolase [Candidatus Nanopelagicales bacterium]
MTRAHGSSPRQESRSRWRRVSAAGLAVVAAAATLTVVPADGQEPRPNVGVDRNPISRSSIDWHPCGPEVECARVTVPLDWDRPQGRSIRLKVAKHAARNPGARIGSLFIGPGGPGESGVNLIKGGGGDLDAWGDGRFDVISWDYRGTNASAPVRCFRTPRSQSRFWRGERIPITPRASREFRATTAALARRCGNVSGWLLPHISTADNARDLNYLRRLSGDRRLTYVGLSYGTYLGQTYANLFPRKVRAMVLDGVVDPVAYSKNAESRIANGVSPSDEVFEQFLAHCRTAGPQRCALAGRRRSPEELMTRFFHRVRHKPVPAPMSDPPGRLSYLDLLVSQFEPMRSPQAWPQDAQSLNAARTGDGTDLENAARPFQTPTGWAGITTSAAIQCADSPARRDSHAWPAVIGRFNRVSRMQGRVQGWWLWAPCASWPVRGQDTYRGPWNASTRHPILLIGTRHDPNTGYANAVRSQRLLGNAVLLTHNGYGHMSFQDPSACVDRARVAYLVHLVAPKPGSVCRPDEPPFGAGGSQGSG